MSAGRSLQIGRTSADAAFDPRLNDKKLAKQRSLEVQTKKTTSTTEAEQTQEVENQKTGHEMRQGPDQLGT